MGKQVERDATAPTTYPASVHVDGRLVPHGAELVLVVAEELEGEVVVPGVVVVPGDGVDAGVGEVLPVAKLFSLCVSHAAAK